MKVLTSPFHLAVLLCSALFLLSACEPDIRPAGYIVIDPSRHYYPVEQGRDLSLSFEVCDTSDHPLFIQEIQTSCGCITVDTELPLVVLPGKSELLRFRFSTIKNVGYVSHYIHLYGNFLGTPMVPISFDTYVVPPADYVHDYEQLFADRAQDDGHADGLSHPGYTTDTLPTPSSTSDVVRSRVHDVLSR